MPALINLYWTDFRVQLAVQFQYRVAMLIWLIGGLVEPVVYLVVWTTIAREQGGSVGSFTVGGFAAYYILLLLVERLTFTWIMHSYGQYIKDGTLATLLLRPVHPIHKDIIENVAYKVITAFIFVPVVVVLVLLFQPDFSGATWLTWLAFVPALLLAGVLRFVTGWTLALAAFWATRIDAVNNIYFVALIFFSGRLAPLELFPNWVVWIANALPFRWMISFPVELGLGRLSAREMMIGFGVQTLWAVVCLALMRFVWRRGVRQFSSVGN